MTQPATPAGQTPGDPTSDAETAAERFLKLRVEYLTKRLDHTLTHTQSASKLIYVIDGGVLAFVAFWVDHSQGNLVPLAWVALPLFVLALLNGLHAQFILVQHSWYSVLDKQIRGLLQLPLPKHDKERTGWAGSTHRLYCAMHLAIAGFLVVLVIAVVFKTGGPEAPKKSAPPAATASSAPTK